MQPSRPPLLGRLLHRLPRPATPWQDTATGYPGATPPVVLVHGTAGSRNNFENLVPVLRKNGHPVLSVSYGHHGTAGILGSLEEVIDQLTGIIDRHGPVDLVGHSQGGLLALAAAGRMEEAGVRQIVGLAADFRGVVRPWFRPPKSRLLHLADGVFSPALADQLIGSSALTAVLGYTTHTAVPVTQIITRGDRIVPEDRARALASHDPATGVPAHRGPVRVVTVQHAFPDARVNHATLPHHRSVGELVRDALASPPGRARGI